MNNNLPVFMKITDALALQEKETISLVGGGGKTTLMFRLAEEIERQYRVVVTTTTKIFLPPPERFLTVLLDNGELPLKDLDRYLEEGLRPVVGAGLVEGNKIKGISGGQVDLLRQHADFILVEADGSKGRSLKGHLDYEPVVAKSTTLVVVVIGADILGKPLDGRYVHRPEIVARLTGREIGSTIDEEMVAGLINHSEGILRDSPPTARVVPFINKMECVSGQGAAQRLGRLLLGERIKRVVLGSANRPDPVAVMEI